MTKPAFLLLLALAFAAPSRSQTAADLSSKYPVVTSYEVRPGILMTPKYTSDGQVCQMSFERRHATNSGLDLDSYISVKLVREIVDELAPPSVRGKSSGGQEWAGWGIGLGPGNTEGGAEFENVSVIAAGTAEPHRGPIIVLITWKNRTCKPEPNPMPPDQHPR